MSRDVLSVVTSGPDGTRSLAGRLVRLLKPGDVVALTGELGAGKTCFVQGVAGALGVTSPVTSPTFTLLKTYEEVDPPLVHVDVYRLDRLHQVHDLGEDVMRADGVTLIEWGDAVEALLPGDRLEVELLMRSRETERDVRLHLHGSWCDRAAEVLAALAPWEVDVGC